MICCQQSVLCWCVFNIFLMNCCWADQHKRIYGNTSSDSIAVELMCVCYIYTKWVKVFMLMMFPSLAHFHSCIYLFLTNTHARCFPFSLSLIHSLVHTLSLLQTVSDQLKTLIFVVWVFFYVLSIVSLSLQFSYIFQVMRVSRMASITSDDETYIVIKKNMFGLD